MLEINTILHLPSHSSAPEPVQVNCQRSSHDCPMLHNAMKHIFWNFNANLKIYSFSHFYPLLSCSFFFTFFSCFSPPILLWNSVRVPCCFLLHSLPLLLHFLFPLPCQFCISEQLIKTHRDNIIFSFDLYGKGGEQLIWAKYMSPRGIDLIWEQQKEESLALEVRATSQCGNYFHFITSKAEFQKD